MDPATAVAFVLVMAAIGGLIAVWADSPRRKRNTELTMDDFTRFYSFQNDRRPVVLQGGMELRDLKWRPGAIPSEASLRRAYLNDEISIEEYEQEMAQLLASEAG
jgi:hypothetical protein